MKILHISDLHIGKVIYEQSLIDDQKYILNQIISIIKENGIEALLISGDIYDRSVPPSNAVDVLNDFLNEVINSIKCKVFIITGNHDSRERLNFASSILESSGLYIQTSYGDCIRKVSLTNNINIYMLPFIKPADVCERFNNGEVSNYSYEKEMNDIIANEEIDNSKINILMAHQFITNNGVEPETCESENLVVGGVENIDASNFKDFDYVALRSHTWATESIKR